MTEYRVEQNTENIKIEEAENSNDEKKTTISNESELTIKKPIIDQKDDDKTTKPTSDEPESMKEKTTTEQKNDHSSPVVSINEPLKRHRQGSDFDDDKESLNDDSDFDGEWLKRYFKKKHHHRSIKNLMTEYQVDQKDEHPSLTVSNKKNLKRNHQDIDSDDNETSNGDSDSDEEWLKMMRQRQKIRLEDVPVKDLDQKDDKKKTTTSKKQRLTPRFDDLFGSEIFDFFNREFSRPCHNGDPRPRIELASLFCDEYYENSRLVKQFIEYASPLSVFWLLESIVGIDIGFSMEDFVKNLICDINFSDTDIKTHFFEKCVYLFTAYPCDQALFEYLKTLTDVNNHEMVKFSVKAHNFICELVEEHKFEVDCDFSENVDDDNFFFYELHDIRYDKSI